MRAKLWQAGRTQVRCAGRLVAVQAWRLHLGETMSSSQVQGSVHQADCEQAQRTSALLVILAISLYTCGLIFVRLGLGVSELRSDPGLYWRLSFEWGNPFNDWWVPVYPLAIA